MKNVEVKNTSFAEFCAQTGFEEPGNYRQVTPNPVAGFKSIFKYDKDQPLLNTGAWELAGEWTKNHFRPAMGGARVLDQQSVVSEMNLSTSPGYPWNRKFKNKRDFLEDEKAREALSGYWEQLLLPEDEMVPIWTCSQKCELRSVEKIAENSLRTFTASPFEHSCALNRICLDMNNKFYDSANRGIWSTVGASKYVSGWDGIYTRLDRFPNAFELDESSFDASIFAAALWGQAEIRFSFLRAEDQTPETHVRLEKLYDSIVNSVIVLENGELVQKATGNPSGSSNTIVDNTMVLYRLFAYAWIVLCEKHGRDALATIEAFHQHVEAALCGDDNTFTVSDAVVAWFNPRGIAEVWSGIGVITKTPSEEPRPLSEVQYLSNGFVYHEPMACWLPIPEAEKVLSSLMYGSNVDDVRWHYLRACALRIDSWGNPTCRRVLSDYITFLDTEYRDRLVGSVERSTGDITMATIRASWKSDAWIEALYCGQEAVAADGPFLDMVDTDRLDAFESVINVSAFKTSKQQQPYLVQDEILQACPTRTMPKNKKLKRERKKLKRVAQAAAVAAAIPRAAKRAAKAVATRAAVKSITGSGDYRPTRFQRVRGRGDYFGDFLGGIGHGVGSLIDGGKSLISKITGFGDYRNHGPSSNSLWANVRGPSEAPFNMGACSVQFAGAAPRVQHREFIMDVVAPANPRAFTTTAFRIQPGLSGQQVLFPWGSSVAKCFQQYKMHGCILEFVSTSSDFSSDSALGEIMMSTQYDANAPALTSVLAVNNNEFTTVQKPSVSFYHPLECASKDSPVTVRYVRSNNTSEDGSDDRLDDVGLFQLSTNGLTASAGTVVGQLWVTYDIEFLKAELPDLHVGTSAAMQWAGTPGSSGYVSPLGPSSAQAQLMPGSSLPISRVDYHTLQMPGGYNGNYLLLCCSQLSLVASSGTWSIAPSFGADITPIELFKSATTNGYGSSFFARGSQATMFAFAFSTIAENEVPAANQIVLNYTSDVTVENAFAWTTFVVPLDNDLRNVLSTLSKQPGIQDLLRELVAAELKQQSRASARPGTPHPVAYASEDEEEHGIELEESVYLPRGKFSSLLSMASAASAASSTKK